MSQETEMIEQDEMVSNTEIIERQFYYLSTLKSYLEDQLKQVNKSLEATASKLPQTEAE